MDKKTVCKKCGHSFSGETPYDLCPRCLMSLGLENEAQSASEAYPSIERIGSFIGHKSTHIECLDLSPDGTRIVSGSFATTKLWDAETGSELMTISDEHGALGIAFSPDGKIIACAGGPDPRDPYNITLWRSGPGQSPDKQKQD
jgi:WD40 repeat protein